jgi:Icc-related predicted phosphoesterase
MALILAVADEVEEALYGSRLDGVRPSLIVGCGDLPSEYLEYLQTRLNVPLVYVPGNHDPDLIPPTDPVWPPAPQTSGFGDPPGPLGGINADGTVVDVAGLRIAGLGGSIRYRLGPNQYTQQQMRTRARRLRRRAAWKRLRDRGDVDVIVSHAPPFGVGDEPDDPAHVGVEALNDLIERLRPRLVLHGHVHPHGVERQDRTVGKTVIMNVIPARLVEI